MPAAPRRTGPPLSLIHIFGNAEEVFGEREFCALGCPTMVATADGSYGHKGFATDLLREVGMRYDYFYTCGPEPMLRAVYDACDCSGQLSFEERMGCGLSLIHISRPRRRG